LNAVCRRIIRLASELVDTALLLAALLLLAAGCYALWDSEQVYAAADSRQYAVYKPTVEDGGLSFEELRSINPEVFAWLNVYGTNIDYPVTQGPDNMKYVNTNAEGSYSLSGAIFLDSSSGADFSDSSSILYGHHMEKKAMFGELGLFADREYFEARRYGSLYYGGRDHGVEFFAFLHADAYDGSVFRTGITDRGEQEAYLAGLLDMAAHSRDIGVTADDRLILLSTCSSSSTNGRDILVGRITEELYGDTFAAAPEETGGAELPAADSLPGLWARLPMPAKAAITGLLLLLLILLAVRHKRKRGKQMERTYSKGGHEI
jgi:sortase B